MVFFLERFLLDGITRVKFFCEQLIFKSFDGPLRIADDHLADPDPLGSAPSFNPWRTKAAVPSSDPPAAKKRLISRFRRRPVPYLAEQRDPYGCQSVRTCNSARKPVAQHFPKPFRSYLGGCIQVAKIGPCRTPAGSPEEPACFRNAGRPRLSLSGVACNVLGARILIAVLGEVPQGHIDDVRRSLGWYGLAFRSIRTLLPLQERVYAPEECFPKPASISCHRIDFRSIIPFEEGTEWIPPIENIWHFTMRKAPLEMASTIPAAWYVD